MGEGQDSRGSQTLNPPETFIAWPLGWGQLQAKMGERGAFEEPARPQGLQLWEPFCGGKFLSIHDSAPPSMALSWTATTPLSGKGKGETPLNCKTPPTSPRLNSSENHLGKASSHSGSGGGGAAECMVAK